MEIKKKAVLAILIFDKVDFKTKAVVRNNQGFYIIIKKQSNNII